MENNIIVEKVRNVLATTLNSISLDEIGLKSKLKEDLGLDSMSSLTFLMALEDNIEGFLVDPDTLDARDLENVESISLYVAKQLKKDL